MHTKVCSSQQIALRGAWVYEKLLMIPMQPERRVVQLQPQGLLQAMAAGIVDCYDVAISAMVKLFAICSRIAVRRQLNLSCFRRACSSTRACSLPASLLPYAAVLTWLLP